VSGPGSRRALFTQPGRCCVSQSAGQGHLPTRRQAGICQHISGQGMVPVNVSADSPKFCKPLRFQGKPSLPPRCMAPEQLLNQRRGLGLPASLLPGCTLGLHCTDELLPVCMHTKVDQSRGLPHRLRGDDQDRVAPDLETAPAVQLAPAYANFVQGCDWRVPRKQGRRSSRCSSHEQAWGAGEA
jgi:hypothetical protein